MKTNLARLRPFSLVLFAAAVLSAGAPSVLAQGGPVTTVFATTGPGTLSEVPGEPAGTTFLSFGAPSIYDPFGLGALVSIQPPAGAAPVAAIVRVQPPVIVPPVAVAQLAVKGGAVLVRAGDPVPDVNGARFTKFGQPVFGAGYGFLGTIAGATPATPVAKGTDTGLWSDVGGSLALVARAGSPAPGVPNATFTQFISSVLPILDANATANLQRGAGLVFLAKIKGSGVTAKNNLGVWFQDSSKTPGSDVSLLFRTGDIINMPSKRDQQPIKGLQLFLPSKNMPGQRRSYTPGGSIMALATFAKGRVCVINARPSNNPQYQLDTYGILENTNVGFPSMPTAFDSTFYAMRAKLFRSAPFTFDSSRKVTAKNDTVILESDNQRFFNWLFETGDSCPFVPNSTYIDFGDPATNDAQPGYLLFTAKLAGPGIGPTNNTVLVQPQLNFSQIVARTGDHALGTPMDVVWKSFVSYAMPEANGQNNDGSQNLLYFLARLTGPGVNATNDTGLWGHDHGGNLVLLTRTGDPINLSGTNRTVSMISTLNAVADSAGQGRFTDVDGHLAALITFTDHSTALVRFTMP